MSIPATSKEGHTHRFRVEDLLPLLLWLREGGEGLGWHKAKERELLPITKKFAAKVISSYAVPKLHHHTHLNDYAPRAHTFAGV